MSWSEYDEKMGFKGGDELGHKDWDFLSWVHDRLIRLAGDSPENSWIVRLDSIIEGLKKQDQAQLMVEKPPLGLTPKRVHNADRIKEITEAIGRYVSFGKGIPTEWVDELVELCK